MIDDGGNYDDDNDDDDDFEDGEKEAEDYGKNNYDNGDEYIEGYIDDKNNVI